MFAQDLAHYTIFLRRYIYTVLHLHKIMPQCVGELEISVLITRGTVYPLST